jgi:hypothetical protein
MTLADKSGGGLQTEEAGHDGPGERLREAESKGCKCDSSCAKKEARATADDV